VKINLHAYRLVHKSGLKGDWVVVADVGDSVTLSVTAPDGEHFQYEDEAFNVYDWAKRRRLTVECEQRPITLPD
jgi:hypothetical protein